MNVFVLCTGRCGSMTFIQACRHMENFSAGHETRAHVVGEQRLNYRDRHIEADNRLAWFLGRLDQVHGDRAIYVHLRRDREATAQSFLQRYHSGILQAYHRSILMNLSSEADPLSVCRDYVDTVTANIRQFLKDKSQVYDVLLERGAADFRLFWRAVRANGDLEAAVREWMIRHNAGPAC
jgi:hypothetical protein